MGGSVGNTLGRVGAGVATGGLSEFAQKNPFLEGAVKNPLAPNTPFFQQNGLFGGNSATGGPSIPGPFGLDPNQVAGDQSALNNLGTTQSAAMNTLGQQQFDQTTGQIPGLVSKQLELENPQIMESLNKNHVLDSSAYPTEIARQQAQLTQQLAVPAMQQLQGTQRGALGTQQGFQTGAVQRGLSLEDFVNQSNVAKNIGAQMAPQPPTAKANAGTTMQGIGAMAPWAKLGKAAAV